MVIGLIYLCLALVGISLLMMIGFGAMHGSHRLRGESKLGLAAFALPIIILVVAFAVDGTWTGAAIATALFTALSGFAALLISGVKSLFS